MLGLVCVPWVENPLALWLAAARGEVGERCGPEYEFRCIAMPFAESDSQVKVNCVLVGVVFSWSSRLTLLGPRGGDESVAAFAIAVEMMP